MDTVEDLLKRLPWPVEDFVFVHVACVSDGTYALVAYYDPHVHKQEVRDAFIRTDNLAALEDLQKIHKSRRRLLGRS